MGHNKTIVKNEIEALSERLAEAPCDRGLLIERGKLYLQRNDFGNALNDFLMAEELTPGQETKEYISMIREILDFRYTDIYNP